MPHEKLTPPRALDELNVERFTYKKDSPDEKKMTNVTPSTKDNNGYRRSKLKEEGRTPFQKLIGI